MFYCYFFQNFWLQAVIHVLRLYKHTVQGIACISGSPLRYSSYTRRPLPPPQKRIRILFHFLHLRPPNAWFYKTATMILLKGGFYHVLILIRFCYCRFDFKKRLFWRSHFLIRTYKLLYINYRISAGTLQFSVCVVNWKLVSLWNGFFFSLRWHPPHLKISISDFLNYLSCPLSTHENYL